jgi:hypothetical protein
LDKTFDIQIVDLISILVGRQQCVDVGVGKLQEDLDQSSFSKTRERYGRECFTNLELAPFKIGRSGVLGKHLVE